MKICVGVIDGATTYGIIEQGVFLRVKDKFRKKYKTFWDIINKNKSFPIRKAFQNKRNGIPIEKIQLLPPISESSKIICVGINYPKIYENSFKPKPENIILFSRFYETIVGHNKRLIRPPGVARHSFDYEGEIAVIIGKSGFKIPRENAMSHVFGYTLFNDGSVREWQRHSLLAGKNFLFSGSCGPYIVTKDEIVDFNDLLLETRVNGRTVQSTYAREMFFKIDEILSYISHIFPLNPGDLIATGSPEGTGTNQTPANFLMPGDSIEISASKLGRLQNIVE